MKRKIVIIGKHAVFVKGGNEIYGTGSAIENFLKSKKINYVSIKHPLHGGLPSLIESFIEGVSSRERLAHYNSTFLPLKSLQELTITFRVINKIVKQRKEPIDLFIGIDPLNAFFATLAKRLGKVRRVIFYTADYAVERFNNPFLNWIYHLLDRYAIKKADQVWNVSTRITKLRRRQGVKEDRNFFVPNSPELNKIKVLSFKEINKHDLVLVSNLTRAIDFPLIIKVVKKLSGKYPDIRLLIIGEGEYKEELEELTSNLSAERNVLFLGRKSHNEVLDILSRAAIGIALYTEEYPWTKFGDSMKVREYLACGLPVIMTGVPSTADDVKRAGAGYVINLDEAELERSIKELFDDKSKYLQMRKRAINLAQQFDCNKLFKENLGRILS